MAEPLHDRRLRFAPPSYLKQNILEDILFHHGLIRGSSDMEPLVVMPLVVLEISRSRESSMMGVFCSICRPDDDVFGCGSGMLISVPLSLLVDAVGCGIVDGDLCATTPPKEVLLVTSLNVIKGRVSIGCGMSAPDSDPLAESIIMD